MTTRKLLFLDIDGVLNSRAWFNYISSPQFPEVPAESFAMPEHHTAWQMLDLAAIDILDSVVKQADCEIVISSTWRVLHSLEAIKKMLKYRGFTQGDRIISMTPDLFIPYKDSALYQGVRRGTEISKWISENVSPEESYRIVIVDDDNDMDGLSPFLVQTDGDKGLTPADARKILELFDA